ncbi:COX15/CtaA family protein [Motiliproteus sp.]|uniref:COX15/CtaA family protein n=1 Tax=Motiliproteus sp. TaxID=1898955 RepID=UPI003BAD9B76
MHPSVSSVSENGCFRSTVVARAGIGPWPLRLARLALVLALVVVLLGGWTRLNNAGLSCPDWPGCYGELILPGSAEGLALAQLRYPSIPIDSARAWLEMTHRYLAAGLGLTILLLALSAYRHDRRSGRRVVIGYPSRISYWLLVLVILQGIFGMWTVTLKLLPQVVTLHLVGGLLTVTLLVIMNQSLQQLAAGQAQSITGSRAQPDKPSAPGRSRPSRPLSRWVAGAALLLFVQIALGGWTSSNYAGWACPHWLGCQQLDINGQPASLDFQAAFVLPQTDQQSFLGGRKSPQARAAIQMTHRGMALLLLLYLLLLLKHCWRYQPLRRTGCAVVGVALTQSLLGGMNVIHGLPLGLAFAHHLGALLLLLLLLRLYRLSVRRARENHYG